MSSRRIPRWIPVIASAVFLLALFAWSEGLFREKVEPADRVASEARPWTGPTAVAATRKVPRFIDVTGTTDTLTTATISSRILGTVEAVLVTEGDRVAVGAPLMRLSAPELAARSASARGSVASAEASLDQARRDLARMQALAEREAATQVELERARTAVAVAEAELSRARQAGAAESAVASHATLTAPFAGIVLERSADPGDLASPGKALLRLGDDSAFRVVASVDEAAAARLELGTEVGAAVESLGLDVPGRLVKLVPATDPRSRTQVIEVSLPPVAGMRAGLFARLRIPGGTNRALVVDPAAVRRVGGLTSVRVLGADGAPRLRAVRLGDSWGTGMVEVLSGLAEGERVAIGDAP